MMKRKTFAVLLVLSFITFSAHGIHLASGQAGGTPFSTYDNWGPLSVLDIAKKMTPDWENYERRLNELATDFVNKIIELDGGRDTTLWVISGCPENKTIDYAIEYWKRVFDQLVKKVVAGGDLYFKKQKQIFANNGGVLISTGATKNLYNKNGERIINDFKNWLSDNLFNYYRGAGIKMSLPGKQYSLEDIYTQTLVHATFYAVIVSFNGRDEVWYYNPQYFASDPRTLDESRIQLGDLKGNNRHTGSGLDYYTTKYRSGEVSIEIDSDTIVIFYSLRGEYKNYEVKRPNDQEQTVVFFVESIAEVSEQGRNGCLLVNDPMGSPINYDFDVYDYDLNSQQWEIVRNDIRSRFSSYIRAKEQKIISDILFSLRRDIDDFVKDKLGGTLENLLAQACDLTDEIIESIARSANELNALLGRAIDKRIAFLGLYNRLNNAGFTTINDIEIAPALDNFVMVVKSVNEEIRAPGFEQSMRERYGNFISLLDNLIRGLPNVGTVPQYLTYSAVSFYYENIINAVNEAIEDAEDLLNTWEKILENKLLLAPAEKCQEYISFLENCEVQLLTNRLISEATKIANSLISAAGLAVSPLQEVPAPGEILIRKVSDVEKLKERTNKYKELMQVVKEYILAGGRGPAGLPKDYELEISQAVNSLITDGNAVLSELEFAKNETHALHRWYQTFYENHNSEIKEKIAASDYYKNSENIKFVVDNYLWTAENYYLLSSARLGGKCGLLTYYAANAVVHLGYAYYVATAPYDLVREIVLPGLDNLFDSCRKYYELVAGIENRHRENNERFIEIESTTYNTINALYNTIEGTVRWVKNWVENTENTDYNTILQIIEKTVGAGGTHINPARCSLLDNCSRFVNLCVPIADQYVEHLNNVLSLAENSVSFVEKIIEENIAPALLGNTTDNIARYKTILEKHKNDAFWLHRESMLERRSELYRKQSVEDNLWLIIDGLRGLVITLENYAARLLQPSIENITLPQIVDVDSEVAVSVLYRIENPLGVSFVRPIELVLPLLENGARVSSVKAGFSGVPYKVENSKIVATVRPGASTFYLSVDYMMVVLRSDIPTTGVLLRQVEERIFVGEIVHFAGSFNIAYRQEFESALAGKTIKAMVKIANPGAIVENTSPYWPPALTAWGGTIENTYIRRTSVTGSNLEVFFILPSGNPPITITIVSALPPVRKTYIDVQATAKENFVGVSYTVNYKNDSNVEYENVLLEEEIYLAAALPSVSFVPSVDYSISQVAPLYYKVSGITKIQPRATVTLYLEYDVYASEDVFDYYYQLIVNKKEHIENVLGFVPNWERIKSLIDNAESLRPFRENVTIPGQQATVEILNVEKLASGIKLLLEANKALDEINLPLIIAMRNKAKDLLDIVDLLIRRLASDCTILDNVRQYNTSFDTVYTNLRSCYNDSLRLKNSLSNLLNMCAYENAVVVGNTIVSIIYENRLSAIQEIQEIIESTIVSYNEQICALKERHELMVRVPARILHLNRPQILDVDIDNLLSTLQGLSDISLSVSFEDLLRIPAIVRAINDAESKISSAEDAVIVYILQASQAIKNHVEARLEDIDNKVSLLDRARQLNIKDDTVLRYAGEIKPVVDEKDIGRIRQDISQLNERLSLLDAMQTMQGRRIIRHFVENVRALEIIGKLENISSVVDGCCTIWYDLASQSIQLARTVCAAKKGDVHKTAMLWIEKAEESLNQWYLLDAQYYAEAAKKLAEGVYAQPQATGGKGLLMLAIIAIAGISAFLIFLRLVAKRPSELQNNASGLS